MNEKELLKSKRGNKILLLCLIVIAVGIVAFIVGIIITGITTSETSLTLNDSGDFESVSVSMPFSDRAGILFPVTIVPAVLLAVLLYITMANSSITITDKRVYGKPNIFKRVDLPLDSICSTGTNILGCLMVSTASGKNRFYDIANRNEMHATICQLLIERQSTQKTTLH